jgi:hypothetical protein
MSVVDLASTWFTGIPDWGGFSDTGVKVLLDQPEHWREYCKVEMGVGKGSCGGRMLLGGKTREGERGCPRLSLELRPQL